MAKDYNATLNLPKTDFPMRAGLPKREPEMLRHWEEIDLYNLQLKKNEGKPLFSLHDGPPFSNGNIHMGHALNKALKDFINRSYMMRGRWVPYIPGWDNHGMPKSHNHNGHMSLDLLMWRQIFYLPKNLLEQIP